jgi:hypothetical protein
LRIIGEELDDTGETPELRIQSFLALAMTPVVLGLGRSARRATI